MDFLKFLLDTAEKGIVAILLVIFTVFGLIITKMVIGFWKEYKSLCQSHKNDILAHKQEYKNLMDKSVECINKNTESQTKMSEAVRDLSSTLRSQTN